ncbi:trifunctional serine/threonine-protein kinase/ATP-binding protein/sensor histidine kinase [Chondromyces crocatus]|uniref:histidine kinase n=1 Tax=Chondromyces crocatus TaxID=52 RepID=A0A0K1E4U3_CHOCO|nr:ATP-binding sensor histidine kinase [Chondromyces crocatus]AKT35906.1 serine/threonine protein kinase [Chondromyces crocatus]
MLSIEGFTVTGLFSEERGELVYRAYQGSRPVLLKVLMREGFSQEDLERLRHGHEIIKGIAPSDLLRVEAIERMGGRLVMVMEGFAGCTLKSLLASRRLTLEESLEIASQTARALHGLHHNRIVHGAIAPTSILVDLASQQVKLTDLEFTAHLAPDRIPVRIEGALHYISPEQTGRIDRAVDQRTDFYSLGITLYEMLSGRRPFEETDPVTLVGNHLAMEARPLTELVPRIPLAVSQIVQRLMAKDVEDRYQSAFGIQADLRACLVQLRQTGSVPDLPIGHHDSAARFQIGQRFYGRENERAFVTDAFARASQGSTELLLVAGYSGVGKSALVAEAQRAFSVKRGYFCTGKFDLLSTAPYGAFIGALQTLIRNILAEEEPTLADRRAQLRTALGSNAQVIIDVLPELELLIGPQPPVPQLGPFESQIRFQLTFQQLMGALARPAHPLVLFLDDIHWADTGSLRLLELTLSDANTQHLLIIGAYRDNAVDETSPLASTLTTLREQRVKLEELSLQPLSSLLVYRLIEDSLGGDKEVAAELSPVVFEKTQGNPFFVKQFLTSLHQRGLIEHDAERGGWHFDTERIQSLDITDNVATLMADKIRKLSARTRRALELAACIGGVFDLKTLAGVLDKGLREASADLREAIREGLVLSLDEPFHLANTAGFRKDDLSTARYQFLHDRVQEAAYALLSAPSRKELHLTIGRLLHAATPPERLDARIFDIVNQLNLGAELIAIRDERMGLARLNLLAGTRAKDSSAFASAASYLTLGRGLLDEEAWRDDHDTASCIHRQLAACDFMLGRFEAADAGFDVVLEHATSATQKGAIYGLKQALYSSRGEYEQSIRMAREAMKLYGLALPDDDGLQQAIEEQTMRLQGALKTRDISSLSALPASDDPLHKARMSLLAHATIYGGGLYPQLFHLLALTSINLSIEYGNVEGSSQGYWNYGLILIDHCGDAATAYRFGKVARELTEHLDGPTMRPTALWGLASYLNPWHEPIRRSLPLLERAHVDSLASGALTIAGYSSLLYVWLSYLSGEEIRGATERAWKHHGLADRTGLVDMTNGICMFLRGWTIFQHGAISPEDEELLGEEALDRKLAHYINIVPCNGVISLQVAVAFHDLAAMRPLLEKGGRALRGIFGHVIIAEFIYYQGLALAALHGTPVDVDEGVDLDGERLMLSLCCDELRIWAEEGPANFLHKHLLLSAEVARVEGRNEEATDLYERAIEEAVRSEFLQDAALASELCARFYLKLGRKRLARACLADARAAWARWGADAKVADIDHRYGDALPPPSTQGEHDAESLDLAAVLRASQAISGEIVLDDLLRKLMTTILESAGAQRGLLLLRGDSQGVVELDRSSDTAGPVVMHGPHSEAQVAFAQSIVRYVERTRERVVLNDTNEPGQSRSDPYLERVRPRSILCMPVVKQKKAVAVLYLENNLVTGAFTPRRCEVLDLLAAQAAISIENARLYDTLDHRVQERTLALDARNEELNLTVNRLQDTQTQLIAQEKLASLGTLTAGIAHELKNPLNFINNFAELVNEMARDLDVLLDKERERIDADTLQEVDGTLTEIHSAASKINQHGKRINQTINGMLLHARGSAGVRESVDLNTLVSESATLAHHGMSSTQNGLSITIDEHYDPEVGSIEVSPPELTRVFINLINNAFYAVCEKRRTSDESYTPVIEIRTRSLERSVEILIRDNGTGIPPDIVDKVFNPFFTTKPPGEGTGLGLSISRDIIRGHRGDILIETRPGKFAEFIVSLPRISRRPAM